MILPAVLPEDIRIIGLDLDGTTFNSQKEITPRTRQAIQTAILRGVAVLPATGRQLQGVPQEFLDIPGVRYVLASNGAKVYDLATGRVLHSDCMGGTQALEVLDICKEYPCLVSLFINGESYTDAASYEAAKEFVPPELLSYFRNSRNAVGDLTHTVAALEEPVEKFALNFKDDASRDEAWKRLDARGDLEVTSSMPRNLELNTDGCTKGSALLALGKALGVQQAGIMAVGDSSNDLAMLEAVGFGVAMGNATPDVMGVADAVTVSNDEDGVAFIIERLLDL